ncbi:Ti-type conjugative transfer relaxase TraA [Stakelama sediminis]|uniref:Ti-type conjugative transfer relaxase TraA n=1 Tax=Stakelama sediminis TaxID=463200 RepID=A0A840Z3J8_9SPHN|nr:Ti-type conjugative transfer relaxase TraA [Stakelama sediminis]MBB5720324.1 Ti-type conjugative transfer relaxase TraA [Stakelama sediminis]
MAIYHFSAKVIGRGSGRSAVAAAAYRSASRLEDERLGRHHDFTNKVGVVHSEVMLPEGAPERLKDREALWNEVEATEKRKDAQLAREVEFAIPRELTKEQGVVLAREFVASEFVDRGMVADLNVHWDIGADGDAKPHAHVMLAMREVGPEGFGAKVREWNETALLQHWRESWANHVNERLSALGIEARVDHRSYDAQGIELEPQHKIGAAGARRDARGEEAERADDHRAIARNNGAAIIADPARGLDTLTRNQATFTQRDLAMFAHRHSDGKEQFDAVLAAMRHHDSVLALGRDGRGQERLTTTSMLSAEEALARDAARLVASSHPVGKADITQAIRSAERRGMMLGVDQQRALEHVVKRPGLSMVVGFAGSGKSATLGVAKEAWESAGYTVRGAALSGIAAENLESGSSIASRTIASFEHGWARGYDRLTTRDVLVIDEAAMIGTRQLQRVLAEASDAGAKVVMVGDAQQLQAIEAGAAFRMLAEHHGAAEIGEVRRQSLEWMRDATRDLALGRTGEALGAYDRARMVQAEPSRDAARTALIDRWDAERRADPAASRIILTHLNKEVAMLNEAARARLAEQGELGRDFAVRTERGLRDFADNDRILFLKNERDLGVKNGTLGTVERAAADTLAVRLDDGRRIAVDLKSYAHIDHGYAATVHKTQGMTVDRTHVLATPGMDAHSAYVALSRHRSGTAIHYGRDDFADEKALRQTLGRERPKDNALDFRQAGQDTQAATVRANGTVKEQASTDMAQSDRARELRAMVAARVAAPKPTAESMRDALARAASAVTGLGRSRDNGAEL